MSGAKHTPGPWAVDPMGLGLVGDVSTADGAIGVAQAMQVRATPGRIDEERAANARLIAAAPDLLLALQKIAGMDGGGTSNRNLMMKQIARAAIAKATGQ